jgi:hypothetical protein
MSCLKIVPSGSLFAFFQSTAHGGAGAGLAAGMAHGGAVASELAALAYRRWKRRGGPKL